MTYEIFRKTMLSVVKTRSPEYYPELVSVPKMNNQVWWGIRLFVNANLYSVVYLEPFYQKLQQGEELSKIMDDVWWECLSATNEKEMEKIDVSGICNYGEAKKHLFIRACSITLNEKMLKDIPYMQILDMAFFAYYRVGDGIVKIKHSHVKEWDIDPNVMLFEAAGNTVKAGLWWATMEEVLCRKPLHIFEGNLSPRSHGMLIFGNNDVYGSSVIFLGNFTKKVGDALGGSYYILPSSIHEVIVLPVSGIRDEAYLKEIVADINRTEMEPEEVLSNNVYFYDIKTNTLEIVGEERNE